MPDLPPYRDDPIEYEDWLQEERALPWRHILAVLAVLGAIVCLNLYFLNGNIQRRVDYAFLRARSALDRRRPHDRYLPTPDLDRVQRAAQPIASEAPAGPSTPPPATATRRPTATPLSAAPTPTPTRPPEILPSSVLLEKDCHEPQGWNNCGPATLAMALCYMGWTGDQYTVASALKPDGEDKNVSPEEMVAYALSLDDTYAAMGYATDLQLLKRLLHAGLPVIVETWFVPEPDDEMGHYRLLTGYDDGTEQFMTQDSYQGADQVVPYGELEELWKVFNRVYVVVGEAERADEMRAILGDEGQDGTMYRSALAVALAEIEAAPEDRYAWFNAGTNHLGLGQVEQAARAYDRARTLRLPWRLLWYQFGPFEAYLLAGRYQDVVDLADANLGATANLEESYYYRALARRALGDEAGARQDLEAALRYNPHFQRAAEALDG
jgi:tetratricopeptide (TPR) repeat protein